MRLPDMLYAPVSWMKRNTIFNDYKVRITLIKVSSVNLLSPSKKNKRKQMKTQENIFKENLTT